MSRADLHLGSRRDNCRVWACLGLKETELGLELCSILLFPEVWVQFLPAASQPFAVPPHATCYPSIYSMVVQSEGRVVLYVFLSIWWLLKSSRASLHVVVLEELSQIPGLRVEVPFRHHSCLIWWNHAAVFVWDCSACAKCVIVDGAESCRAAWRNENRCFFHLCQDHPSLLFQSCIQPESRSVPRASALLLGCPISA